MLPLRLVIDTNVVVSAALKPDGLQRTVPLLALTKPARLYGSFEDNVTADLVHLRVLPSPAQVSARCMPDDVARDLHATDKISSRTRWRRIRSGRDRSKEYADLLPVAVHIMLQVDRWRGSNLATKCQP
jgi:hypothetical protein